MPHSAKSGSYPKSRSREFKSGSFPPKTAEISAHIRGSRALKGMRALITFRIKRVRERNVKFSGKETRGGESAIVILFFRTSRARTNDPKTQCGESLEAVFRPLTASASILP